MGSQNGDSLNVRVKLFVSLKLNSSLIQSSDKSYTRIPLFGSITRVGILASFNRFDRED